MNANVRKTLQQQQAGKRSPNSQVGTAVWTDGNNIFSYRTCIYAVAGVFNATKYSVTTSRIQNQLRNVLRFDVTVDNIRIGVEPVGLESFGEEARRNAGGAK